MAFFHCNRIMWVVYPGMANPSSQQGPGFLCYFFGDLQCLTVQLLHLVLFVDGFQFLPVGAVLLVLNKNFITFYRVYWIHNFCIQCISTCRSLYFYINDTFKNRYIFELYFGIDKLIRYYDIHSFCFPHLRRN